MYKSGWNATIPNGNATTGIAFPYQNLTLDITKLLTRRATMSLPTLDMSLFFGTCEEQQKFSSALLQHLKSRGVAKIKNHGIPDEQISGLFHMVSP